MARINANNTPELCIELSVRLTDGSFETMVQLPVKASQAARDATVSAWFKLIQSAITCYSEAQQEKAANEE